jgi:hypothetical protein
MGVSYRPRLATCLWSRISARMLARRSQVTSTPWSFDAALTPLVAQKCTIVSACSPSYANGCPQIIARAAANLDEADKSKARFPQPVTKMSTLEFE